MASASAPLKNGVYLDFKTAIDRLGRNVIEERYGNLFDMYENITGENPYEVADAHLPGGALHDGRALGGLQPDVATCPGCSSSAKRTSRTTAPTGLALAR